MWQGRCPINVCSDSWKLHVEYAAAFVFSLDGDHNRSLDVIQHVIRPNVTFDEEVRRVQSGLMMEMSSRQSVVFATVASDINAQLENLIHSAVNAKVELYILGLGMK
jgi:hypothetical protein